MTSRYVLQHPAPCRLEPPRLDPDQQAVVDHPGGPLLVLAGPGTGKTTTLVEVVVDRIQRRGLRADEVLVLTFGRKAAAELRARIAARLSATTTGVTATTFHAFCFSLVRRFQDPDAFVAPLRLLSAAEQDVVISDLLVGSVRAGTVDWPVSMVAALGTRGLATEVQRVVARARERGLDPGDVVTAGRRAGRPEWVAAGQFFADYLDVCDAQNAVDYTELVHRAGLVASSPQARRVLHRQLRLVVVDEYQDTDPGQVALLRQLAGEGRDLVVVGDPDQSIYAFRGADAQALLRFPREFPCADGRPAPTYALGSTRRFGEAISRASREVIGQVGVCGSVDRAAFEAFRRPRCVDPAYGSGQVRVATFLSAAAEAEHVAALLRRARLADGIPWQDMAVLVRSGAEVVRLHRALAGADVPVEVAGDEVPLRFQPLVRVLLSALRAASRPEPPDATLVEALLTSPLGAMDVGAVRRLARQLRERDTRGGERPPRPSDELLAAAFADPDVLAATPGAPARRALPMARLVWRARRLVQQRAAAEDVLWEIWSSTSWPRRLHTQAQAGGDAARAAHRDLDAACALFATAARGAQRQSPPQLADFLAGIEAQQVPADPLPTQRVRGDAVRLLTAHRAKGLQWRLVVVAGVQEGSWPDLRRRGSFLEAERLERGGLGAAPTGSELLAEERRLFYVAVTRARERLVVTAVAGPGEDGDQPSRFLSQLGVPIEAPLGRPSRPVSLRGVLAELRCIAETTDDPQVRLVAARAIARLAVAGASGHRGLDCAHPDAWWGVRAVTASPTPVRPSGEPIELSGSGLEALLSCPLRWFLAREAGAEAPHTPAQGFGKLLHALAESVASGDCAPDPVELDAHVDRVWHSLAFPAPWISVREREEAAAAVRRFVAWHGARRGRRLVAAEEQFQVEVPVAGDRVVLRGRLDRVELDASGHVVVVDLKSGRRVPTRAQVERHPQLGTYQLAVRHGGISGVGPDGEPGGAELVHLRAAPPGGSDGLPRVQHQDPGAARAAVEPQLELAVRTVRDEAFLATPGEVCRHCDFSACCPARPEGLTLLAAQSQPS